MANGINKTIYQTKNSYETLLLLNVHSINIYNIFTLDKNNYCYVSREKSHLTEIFQDITDTSENHTILESVKYFDVFNLQRVFYKDSVS